ncbi:TetR/AcrR family transcriptional regulator [Actinomadura rupiterrae]|uniref:TetR/AcrR family transcriptional regulator n=1 Tax=Actinomadura rupiterrae TaxID=559627 RepID=UPI0020A46A33|nr:TetR/AcrR family transcriptional regulator [Actinomadura rupiterrae]MCP2341549.1 AcrR family transcriptional regulator [Actinomadura rupiterrae]
MPRSNASRARTGRPPATSRAEILAAARLIIERDGWERLTVRRLAAELGIGTTTLYHHVRDREDLLVQLLNEHSGQTLRADLPADPRDRIVAAALAMHDALAAWPWAAEVLTTDGFIPRLGEPALRVVETILAAAIEYGCGREQAVHLFRALWYFTVGEILVRAHTRDRRTDALRPGDPFFSDDLDMSALPSLAAIGDQWPALAAQDTYPQALEAFVDGLLTQATS